MYDVKHLRYFVAVATERSFTRGAEKLNMAQPPLSRRIQEMEDEVGTLLFDREARPLALTPAGQLFYEQSVRIIQQVEQMRLAMKQYVSGQRSRFAIGLVPSTLYARLPDVIRHLRENAPGIDINLVDMSTVEQIAALKDGRIHVGFGLVRIDDPAIRREVLREERLAVAIPPGHILAAGAGPLGLSELTATPLIVYPREPRPSYADQVLGLFHDHGLACEDILEVRELQTAMVMVAAGGGVCLVPDSIRQSGRSDIVFRDLAEPATTPIIMNYRQGDSSAELKLLFRTFVELYGRWGIPVLPSLSGLAC